MASTSVSMSLPLTTVTHNKLIQPSSLSPLPIRQQKTTLISKPNLGIQASLKEKAVTVITVASLTASMVIPEVAHAATSDLSPSLQSFLFSTFAGGVVLFGLLGAVLGVSKFDPVKRT
ncbi:hypothetical protein Lal_00004702 [Lupinus albus]|uniref:Putative photosystem II n=1 Tax=Lupinus albus TaxID=3870 RepID=A0A6A5LYR6_LUPAL|nr:putative photosystem II [Lupinus albus]KAF1865328.1 hypothetical protein Lal_00004702 [Lupinus albus]